MKLKRLYVFAIVLMQFNNLFSQEIKIELSSPLGEKDKDWTYNKEINKGIYGPNLFKVMKIQDGFLYTSRLSGLCRNPEYNVDGVKDGIEVIDVFDLSTLKLVFTKQLDDAAYKKSDGLVHDIIIKDNEMSVIYSAFDKGGKLRNIYYDQYSAEFKMIKSNQLLMTGIEFKSKKGAPFFFVDDEQTGAFAIINVEYDNPKCFTKYLPEFKVGFFNNDLTKMFTKDVKLDKGMYPQRFFFSNKILYMDISMSPCGYNIPKHRLVKIDGASEIVVKLDDFNLAGMKFFYNPNDKKIYLAGINEDKKAPLKMNIAVANVTDAKDENLVAKLFPIPESDYFKSHGKNADAIEFLNIRYIYPKTNGNFMLICEQVYYYDDFWDKPGGSINNLVNLEFNENKGIVKQDFLFKKIDTYVMAGAQAGDRTPSYSVLYNSFGFCANDKPYFFYNDRVENASLPNSDEVKTWKTDKDKEPSGCIYATANGFAAQKKALNLRSIVKSDPDEEYYVVPHYSKAIDANSFVTQIKIKGFTYLAKVTIP